MKTFAFYVYQVMIILGSIFYFIIKGAAGHGFIWRWYELVICLVALISIVFGYLDRSNRSNKLINTVSVISFVGVFIVSIVIFVSIVTFRYGADINPIFFYVLAALFMWFAGLNSYAAFVRRNALPE